MTELFCNECGSVTAKLVKGSSVRKGTITYCSKCSGEPEDPQYNNHTYKNDEDTLDLLKNLFGFK